MTADTELLVSCDECSATSESGWGDTALCLDCEDAAQICTEHLRTFVEACPLDHAGEDEMWLVTVERSEQVTYRVFARDAEGAYEQVGSGDALQVRSKYLDEQFVEAIRQEAP